MGKLICVCNEADEMNCDRCLKNKDTKPDHIIRNETWPRNPRGHKQAVHPDARRSKSGRTIRSI
jgi:hypothetical protein